MREYHIDFVKNKKIYFAISIALLVVAVLFSAIFGVNLDIQFKGGTIVTYSYTNELDHTAFQQAFESAVGGTVSLQETTDVTTGAKNIKVSLSEARGVAAEQLSALSAQLDEQFPHTDIKMISANSVDPTIGKEFLAKSMVAVAFASLLMIVYVALRFKVISGWSAGVTAVVALFHDVMVIYATFVIFRIPLNDNFIAVVLTILGYSLNDTIVIYDRVRENKRLYGSKLTTAELMNKSINQSLARTMATTATTIMAMAVVLVVAIIYNVDSIIFFAFPLIVGMLSGVYSSLCLSGNLWVMWQEHKIAKKKR